MLGLVAVLLIPSIALACPACPQEASRGSMAWLLAAAVLAPWGVLFGVVQAVRRLEASERAEAEGSGPPP